MKGNKKIYSAGLIYTILTIFYVLINIIDRKTDAEKDWYSNKRNIPSSNNYTGHKLNIESIQNVQVNLCFYNQPWEIQSQLLGGARSLVWNKCMHDSRTQYLVGSKILAFSSKIKLLERCRNTRTRSHKTLKNNVRAGNTGTNMQPLYQTAPYEKKKKKEEGEIRSLANERNTMYPWGDSELYWNKLKKSTNI